VTEGQRFKPPTSAVADVDRRAGPSDGVRLALAIATLLQLLLFFAGRPARVCLELMDIGVLSPIGGVALAAGLACLYLGVIRLVGAHRRGARLLTWSIVLQLLAIVVWHRFFLANWGLYAFVSLLVPYAFGLVVAVWARLAAPSPAPARPGQAAAEGSGP
jgi:hypothetical protein